MTTDSSNTRKRILVLTSTFPRWEGDHEPPFVFELSKRLVDQFDVMVLAPHAAGAKLTENIKGLEVHRFRYCLPRFEKLAYDGGILANLKQNPLVYFLVPLFILSELISLIRILHQYKIDVIHAHWIIPQGLVAITASLFTSKRPIIIGTSHGADLFGLPGKLFRWIKRMVIRHIDMLTVVSHAMRAYANQFKRKQEIEVISMGVDLTCQFTPAYGANRKTNEILFVGRLVEKKGVQYLIQAMPEILERYPCAELLIIGDGPARESLQKLADLKKLGSKVQFLGAIANTSLQDKYRHATIFVAPSIVAQDGDQEGLGLVLVEALGCECPVIASDLPAIRDVIIHNKTGLICKQKDSKDLALKIITLLGNRKLRESLGRAGRQHVLQNFDWKIIADRYKKLIDSAIKKTQ